MRGGLVRGALIGATLATAMATGGQVRAQPADSSASAEDLASAEALFREAKELMRDGAFNAACSKFAASHRLDPALGTLLNLADCNEKAGHTASAWALFLQAETLSRRDGNELREKVASDRAAALEPRLIRLAIVVPAAARVPGLTIHRDGVLVEDVAWGSPYPIDPGAHEIVASAPGRQEWRTTVTAVKEGDRLSIDIPALPAAADAPPAAGIDPGPETPPAAAPTPAPAAPSPTPARPPEQDRADDGSGQRTAGLIVGGVGLLGIIVGSGFGISAMSKWDEAGCEDGICPDDASQDLSDGANQNATIATASFVAGLAVVGFGVTLYLTAPDGSEAGRDTATLRLTPAVGPESGSVVLFGRF